MGVLPFCDDEDESKPLNVRGFKDCTPRPPCPKDIDFRSQSKWVPGKNCKLVKAEEIPFCEDEDESKPLNVRGLEDCKPKPPCPQGVDFRSQSKWAPGKNCKLVKLEDLPFCPDESKEEGINVRSNEDLVPGVTCRTLPKCPQGIDFRSQSEWVPGKNCKLVKEESEEVPFCNDEDESKPLNVRGLKDCKPRPPCPQGIDFRSQSE